MATPAIGGDQGGRPDNTIVAKEKQGDLVFRPTEETVRSGGALDLKNRTEEPHTFSVVTRADIPSSRQEERQCFRRGICGKLFEAHNEGEKQLVDRHDEGFDQPIDSIILEEDPLTIDVTAERGRELSFFCAIHPNMQGRVHVH